MRTIWNAFLDGLDRHCWTIVRLNIAHALVALLWIVAYDILRDIDAEQDAAIAACAAPYIAQSEPRRGETEKNYGTD